MTTIVKVIDIDDDGAETVRYTTTLPQYREYDSRLSSYDRGVNYGWNRCLMNINGDIEEERKREQAMREEYGSDRD